MKNMERKIKIYRMPLSRVSPATHTRAGAPTEFAEKIKVGTKLHTIRALKDNPKGWYYKIKEVEGGNAVLVLYTWSGKTYRSRIHNLFVFAANSAAGFVGELMKDDRYKGAIPVIGNGFGVQKALFMPSLQIVAVGSEDNGEVHTVEYAEVAANDGLSPADFKSWLAGYDLSKPMAIIQFTKFRY
jgi:hypothetical protein